MFLLHDKMENIHNHYINSYCHGLPWQQCTVKQNPYLLLMLGQGFDGTAIARLLSLHPLSLGSGLVTPLWWTALFPVVKRCNLNNSNYAQNPTLYHTDIIMI